jgi:hypothetical protein
VRTSPSPVRPSCRQKTCNDHRPHTPARRTPRPPRRVQQTRSSACINRRRRRPTHCPPAAVLEAQSVPQPGDKQGSLGSQASCRLALYQPIYSTTTKAPLAKYPRRLQDLVRAAKLERLPSATMDLSWFPRRHKSLRPLASASACRARVRDLQPPSQPRAEETRSQPATACQNLPRSRRRGRSCGKKLSPVQAVRDGRGWDRTSDPSRVKRVLSR